MGVGTVLYVFDVYASKASKVVLLHLWHINIRTSGEFISIPVEDFHMVKTAPQKYNELYNYVCRPREYI